MGVEVAVLDNHRYLRSPSDSAERNARISRTLEICELSNHAVACHLLLFRGAGRSNQSATNKGALL